MRAGADLRLATGLGETPVQLALRYEKIACAQFLSCTGTCTANTLLGY